MHKSVMQILADFFNHGGPFMWVILIVFAVACAVALERLIFYFVMCRNDTARLVADLARALNEDRIDEAHRIALRKKAPVNMLLAAAIDCFKAGMPLPDIQEGVDEAAIKELPRMTQRLNYLSLFANIGTLLGLLGTIAGLQQMFSSLAAVEAEKKAAMLASGISQAMNATAFGLIVAIPCMVLYTAFFNKQAHLMRDLDEAVVRFMNYLRKKLASSHAGENR
jgi:biopolymer transport protein ExbB/TolQ